MDLIEKLVEEEFLDREKAKSVREGAKTTENTVEEILLEQGIISEDELFKLKGEVFNVPFKKDFDTEEIVKELLWLIPENSAYYYKMVPVGKEGDTIEIGMVYPEDWKAQEALKFIFRKEELPYSVHLISLADFYKISKAYGGFAKESALPLIERLIKEGILDQKKADLVKKEAEEKEKTIEEVLLEQKTILEEDLFKLKSEVFNIPLKEDIDPEKITEDLLRLIPEDSVHYYKMVPVGKEGDTIEIGMVYPENLRAQEALKFISSRKDFSPKTYLISLSAFEGIGKKYRTLTKEVGAALEDLDIEAQEKEEEAVEIGKDIERLAEEAPIVKVVAVILRNAIEGGASDIHIEPSREKMKIRFRVDGILHSSLFLPMNTQLATVARMKILAGLKIDERRLPQDGRFSAKIEGKNIDFRVSTFPTTLGEKVVIRVLDPGEGLKTIEELGVTEKNFQILNRSIKRPTGMTLATGPTGSGKTTTLYAILKILNKEQVNIVTLEDPVEYFIEGISQSQVHPEIGYVFSKGLRQILRQDPDIIMVGEVRDDETADLAVHAALTGHVVLSTLHTNNAVGVIPRLIDMGIKPFLIPPALNTMMSQRLVRRICDNCKEQVTPSREINALIAEELKKVSPEARKELNIPSSFKIYKAKGCKYCSEEGVKGRIGIFEILAMTDPLGEIIMKDPTERKLNEEAFRQGMITLKQDGIIKAIQGYTTIEEVLRATEEK